jgi:hypothetical protein
MIIREYRCANAQHLEIMEHKSRGCCSREICFIRQKRALQKTDAPKGHNKSAQGNALGKGNVLGRAG